MSEGDVSLIRDEDVLRRMWQQTEDFGRKKEIRAHMYRLREERLRTLYSPEPRHDKGKGVEVMHVSSLQDQSFQGLKSKEVRDAGSPPKDFGRQDLTPLSTAGWNVQCEQRSSADGLTSSRAVRADVQGGYDVEGGRGQFAAVDSHRQVHSEYQDGNTSVKKDEATAKTANNEQVLRQTDDGTHFSSTKSSSTSSSNYQQVSSTTEVPYTVPDDSVSCSKYARNTNTSDYEKTLRSSNFESGELISRKVDYPDDNTKVIVETRCLPDGTRITSTRKEFCTPVQSTHKQQHSSRSEIKSYSNTSHRADTRESSKISRGYDIVEAQRQADDYDFKRNRVQDDNSQTQRNIQKTSDTKRFDSKDSSSKIIRETVDRQNISDTKFDTTDSSTKFIREIVDHKQDISDSKLDTRDSSSKIIRETVDRRQDVSDTQKHVDDFDSKRNVQIDQNTRSDDVRTERINRHHETKTDTNRREIITSDDKRDQHTDYSTIHRIDRHDAKVDETDRREVISSRDKQNIKRDVKESNYVKNNEERIHNITRDQKVEEIVEKKSSDQYQTTYQTDYTQKKISNDWSPSHQAWASTLRGDSPASARPSTRASSPGSRTLQSSTSSLRSSVSPDKGCRKPPSRGGSPNKTDRSSPSRYSTDRYSSTTSTHSVTESRNYKHTSPDRKPPKSPTRYGSPDSKPDGYRQRPSLSPEKRPQEFRPSSSPERKPGARPTEGYPRTTSPSRPVNGTPRSSASPDRKPTYHPSERPDSRYPHATSPIRSIPEQKFPDRPKDISFEKPSTSPDRQPGYKSSPASTPSDYPRTVSPTRPYAKDSTRPGASPDRKPGYEHPKPSKVSGDLPKESSPTSPSASPDRKPSYMKPTASSQTPDRKSSTKQVPSQSPERKPYGKTTIKEDHYKLIDAETKMYTRTDRDDSSYNKMISASPDRFSGPRDRSPSPSRSPDDVPDYSRADSPSLRSSLRKGSRSPSPPKGPVTFTDDHVNRNERIKFTSSDVTKKYDEDITRTFSSSKPTRDVPREPSPTKYRNYDKKRRTEETEEVTSLTTRKDTTDVKYDSLTHRDKTTKKTETPLSPTKTSSKEKSTDAPREPSPVKYGTYDKKRRSEEVEEITSTTKNTADIKYDSLTRKKSDSRKVPESPTLPIKKHPRESVSPVKSPTKDTKYKHTTDFITTERTTEEINKKTVSKDRPRQLVTPSTSPTRKPKTDDTAPSTGQSSPTTSVSEFVYFSSPKTEKTIVTDLDDEIYFSTVSQSEEITTNINERPKTLNVERSPSPSKIPCRSPSVEVKKTPTKDSLPRKSSLKKPSTDSINLSPDEKPPSSFRVSPTDEVPQHKIVKKDRPDKPVDSPIKPKSPFERRETYEERCLKILGVVDDDTQTESTETLKLRSSSVSPCRSPAQKESSPLGFYTDTNEINSVSEFISKEQDDTIKKTITRFEDIVTSNRNLKTPSREPSPAKLQDIISQKTVTKHSEDVQKESISKITRDSPNRDIGYQKPRLSVSPEKKLPQTVKDSSPVRPGQSPERKHQVPKSVNSIRSTSPVKSVPQYGTPTKPSHQPTKSSPVKPDEEQPKEMSPTKPSVSPDRKPGYMKSTASTTHKYESLETSENHETTVRRTIDKETGYRKTKDESPHRPSTSPEKEPGYCLPSTTKSFPDKKEEKSPKRSSVSPDQTPGYMRPTAATITKFEETSMVEDMTVDLKDVTTSETVHKHSITKVPEKTSRSGSPTKKPGEVKQPRSQSPSKKTTTTTDDTTLLIQSEREREVLDRVQQSLRKLSPSREQRSPSREKSPGKSTISLQDIDVVTTETNQISTKVTKEDIMKTSCEKGTSVKTDVTRTVRPNADKPKEQKPVAKTPSRTVSPTKKPTSPTQQDSSPDSTDKSRSISPKKPLSPTERSQSPHVSKPSGIKPREPTPSSLLRKPSGNMSPPKIEKVTTDTKKSTSITKQNSTSKIATKTTTSRIPSSTSKTEPEPKRAPTPKGINKENVSPRKDEVKVTRTASDTSLKNKKPSPQRMKSKPEIQVNDLSPTRTPKMSNLKKPSGRDTPTKLAPKPKSATALNSTKDDDEIIIDVEQAKSSRENSPDRICPTPVSFLEDVGTPRYPDAVYEPDDDFRNRTHHTIHETESIVDDIVEISEDDELFVKKTDLDHITKSDECLLSVTDKVFKFTNKIETITKPKDSTTFFKDTERRVHSDFINENLKSDECLLSVSEKVNKFAKGPQEKRDKSPSRRIVDEFDTETVYQDDYTKLSVNDKAHLFIETAENVKAPKTKPAQKVERPDLSDVDESLKSDECLMSVSDKVHKFVKTAEQFLQESHETENKERKVKEQYEKFMQQLGQDDVEDTQITKTTTEFTKTSEVKDRKSEDKAPSFAKETASSHTKVKEYASPNLKPAEKTPNVKITTLRNSEAVKKAKALFENIATTQQTKETKTIKLLDIGVTKKSSKTDSTTVLHPSVENLPYEPETEVDGHYKAPTKERPVNGTSTRLSQPRYDDRRSSPSRHTTQSPEVPRIKSPSRQSFETTTTTKTVLSRYPAAQNETPKKTRPDIEKVPKRAPELKQAPIETEKPFDKIPSYQRPTATSQIKEEKTVEETEVTNRRGSGKFGVELRRTSVERSNVSSERRRSSADHHQPCIEDIFDLDLLEQMLEKVVGYEQRRRIRAQIRVARKKLETKTDTTYTTHTKQTTTTKTRSPERRPQTKSPERHKSTPIKTEHYTSSIPQKSTPQSDHSLPKEHSRPMTNGHAKEPGSLSEKRQRPQSPEKPRPALKTQSPVRQPSPEKKLRTASPTKVSPKPKSNRFSEYASAYMKKVGLNETDKVKLFNKTKATTDNDDIKTRQSKTSNKIDYEDHTTNKVEEHSVMQTKSTSMSKSFSERTSSKETIEVVHVNGKRSPSPEKKRSPTRHIQSPSERLYQRSPSPDFKRKNDLNKKETIVKTVYETDPRVTKKETIIRTVIEERPRVESKKETIIKTVYDIEKKMTPKQPQEEKPSWAVNRNLKKVSAVSRSFSSRRAEEKKSASPGKALARPIDAVVSSYGPGPLDADGRPLFGIKALRNGSSNYQVKGTVIRQEFHSRNGGEPEGSVSVTAYSTEPEDLERLLQCQGEKPSRIHGLAAITTTKKFGGETGTTLKEAHSKEERAALEQFTHNERRVSEDVEMCESRLDRACRETPEEKTQERTERRERREDKKTVRQSSVKSLTEKYIKSASDTSKSERAAYPKAGLILRTATLKDSVSSDSSAHAGLGRTNSAHSLGSVDDQAAVTSPQTPPARREPRGEERSFLDSSTKVTGVQDILTRMRNADIVIEDGDTTEDSEARALLNKFLGATVLMAGMQGYMQPEKPPGNSARRQETTRTSSSGGKTTSTSRRVEEVDLERCWDERLLRKLLEESSDYEQRRRIRARIRNLMAEQEACATAVSEALGADSAAAAEDAREEAEVAVTSSVRRDSSEKTVSSSTTSTTKSSKVIESAARPAPKTVSPFAKFRQLEKQNSLNSTNSPQSPKSPSQAPYFKFTDPALQASALTIKERLLQWCRDKTRDYENVKLENFSTSWADGLAFCALVHHFLPTAFDYSQLTPQQRRHNFTLAFKVADEKAGIYPLLDVDDMVAMRKPDWKCVFTYVQAIHRRFKDEP